MADTATVDPATVDPATVDAVRRFNRFWTRQIGVLQAGLLDTPYSLTEARVIFELAQADGTDLGALRDRLGLDGGYLSRVVGRFKADGLVTARVAATDARRQILRLSARGRRVFARLDQRAAAAVVTMLANHEPADHHRLIAALDTVEGLLSSKAPAAAYVIRGLRPGELGWAVARHGAIYAEEYGWDESFEALVARIVADYVDDHDPKRENAWIAEVDGEPAGCVFCCRRDDTTAQLRILLVEPRARGLGIGSRLVDECIDFARRAGYRTIMLWTNDVLVAARRIYEAAGFSLIEEEPHHSYGKDLVGQIWELDLRS
jgi:DNA-binding MarR family transcriptional regulator/N-acetylglutamate synthase-like GNAT family acetyltransferase